MIEDAKITNMTFLNDKLHTNLSLLTYIYFNYCIRVNSTETIRDTYVVAPETS